MAQFQYITESVNLDSLYSAALFWLKRGAGLIPCQHDSKFIVEGFGPARRQITHYRQAERYFKRSGYNLAVLLPASTWCLDFDDFALFNRWAAKVPADVQLTHQESTPRGWHLFYQGDLPAGLHLVPGVEIKRSVLVAPSVVAGVFYVDLRIGDILEINSTDVLFPLLSEKEPEPVRAEPVDQARARVAGAGDDLITRIKARWSVLYVASRFTELRESPPGQKRWYVGRCPLHDDQHPSLWVDAERDLWGCFSPDCIGHAGEGFRGHDVINLVALYYGIDNHAAIKRLARGVEA